MKDLLRTADGDFMIKNNDLVIGFSDQQHRADLLLIDKGELKQFPAVGVGAYHFIEAEDEAGLLREIAMQYSADGMKVKSLAITNGKILVEAHYE